MKNPFSGLFRARDKPQDSVSAAPVFYFGTSGSGKTIIVHADSQLPLPASELFPVPMGVRAVNGQ